jgi:flagellin-like hook-associated protein FlgL
MSKPATLAPATTPAPAYALRTDLDAYVKSTTLGTMFQNLSTEITNTYTKTSSIGTLIQPQLTDLQTSLKSYADNTSVVAAQGDIGTLKTSVTGIQTNFGNMNTTLTGALNDIGTLKTNFKTQQTSLTGTQTDIKNLQTSVSTSQNDIKAIKDSLKLVNDKLATFVTKTDASAKLGAPTCRNVSTDFGDDGNNSGHSVVYLDKHTLQCNAGEYLSSFHLQRDATQKKFQLQGKCCKLWN